MSVVLLMITQAMFFLSRAVFVKGALLQGNGGWYVSNSCLSRRRPVKWLVQYSEPPDNLVNTVGVSGKQ